MAVSDPPDVRIEIDFEHDLNPADVEFPEPTWTDVTSYLRSPPNGNGWWIRRGRNREVDRIETGQAGVDLINIGGEFLPFNIDSPFHPFILPMRRIHIIAEVQTGLQEFRVRSSHVRESGHVLRDGAIADVCLFDGLIDSWAFEWPGRGVDGTASLTAVDLLTFMKGERITTSRPNENASDRINALLDLVPFGTNRVVEEGHASCQAVDYTDDDLLDSLRMVEVTDDGVLFVNRNGEVTFYPGSHRTDTVPYGSTFSMNTGDHPFVDIKMDYDAKLIRNVITVTAPGEDTVIATDNESISRYSEKPYEIATLLDNAEAITERAEDVLQRYAHPFTAIRELDLNGVLDDWLFMTQLDIWDRVILDVQMPDGTTLFEQTSLIEGIRYSSVKSPHWAPTLQLSSVEHPNLLEPDDQASVEDTIAGWAAETNCTLNRAYIGDIYTGSQPRVLSGAFTLELRPTADGDLSCVTTPFDSIPVDAGGLYRLKMNVSGPPFFFGVDFVADRAWAEIEWLTSGGGIITKVATPAVNWNLGWLALTTTEIAPANSAFARIRLYIDNYARGSVPGSFPIYFWSDANRFGRVG